MGGEASGAQPTVAHYAGCSMCLLAQRQQCTTEGFVGPEGVEFTESNAILDPCDVCTALACNAVQAAK